MKFMLVFFLTSVIFVPHAFSQLTGLGPLKIGVHKKILDSIVAANGMTWEEDDFKELIKSGKLMEVRNYLNFEKDSKQRIKRLKPDSEGYSFGDESELYVDGVQQYQLNFLKIGDLKINKVLVSFKDSILYRITADTNLELSDALEIKYGKPKLDVKEKTVYCKYKLTGVSEPLKEQTFYKDYVSAPGIKAQSVLYSYYDDKCKKNILAFIEIGNTNIIESVRFAAETFRERLKENKKKEKAEKYSGL